MAPQSRIRVVMKRWRTLAFWQRTLVSVPIGTGFCVMMVSLFRGQISSGIVIGTLFGALAATIAAARMGAEDPVLNAERFAGELRYDDSTGRGQMVPVTQPANKQDP